MTNNLNEVCLNYSVAPHRPERICVLGTSTLLYLHSVTNNQKEVQWLDCRTSSPRPTRTASAMNVKTHFGVYDVCCMQQKSEQFVITTHGHKGISAYSVNTNQLQWHIEGKVPGCVKVISAQGITVDGHGCLFVCDEHNNCIRMLSADGMFIGAVPIPVEYGIPWRLRWSSVSLSLVAVCFKDTKYHICRLSIQKRV